MAAARGRGDRVDRLLRRIRRADDLRAGGRRVVESLPAAIQIALAAAGAYAFARYVLGHPAPFVAATVTLSSLGFTRDARPRRVLEVTIGMVVGILFSELVVHLVGKGWWQLALVLGGALLIARFLSPSSGFAIVAGVQALMVVVLAEPEGGAFTRALDGMVGGAAALVATALVPRDPRRIALREARKVLQLFGDTVLSLAGAARAADQRVADDLLARLRASQHLVDGWSSALDSAIAVAEISPFSRRHRPELHRQQEVLRGVDLAMRNLRVVARRLDFLVGDGKPRPEVADLLSELSEGVVLLSRALEEPSLMPRARQSLTLVALRLDPARLLPKKAINEKGLVLLLRPLLVDLLSATGASAQEARQCLPRLPDEEG